MKPVSIHDLLLLQDYFAKKSEPSEKDKERLQKLDDHLCAFVDGISMAKPDDMSIDEMFKRFLEAMPRKSA